MMLGRDLCPVTSTVAKKTWKEHWKLAIVTHKQASTLLVVSFCAQSNDGLGRIDFMETTNARKIKSNSGREFLKNWDIEHVLLEY